MRQMLPTFDIDLKQLGNATLFEKNTREASERLQIKSSRRTPWAVTSTAFGEKK